MNIQHFRIKILRSLMGTMTQKDFAETHGLDASYLSQLLNGHRALGEKAAANLEIKLQIPPGTLVSPNDRTDPATSHEHAIPTDAARAAAEDVHLPLLSDAEEQPPSVTTGSKHGSTFRFNRLSLAERKIRPDQVVCVRVSGNSMAPVLPDGAVVAVDKAESGIVDGKVYVLNHDGLLRAKLLLRLPRGGMRIRSFNRDEHEDEDYTKQDLVTQKITIIGKVFWYSAFI